VISDSTNAVVATVNMVPNPQYYSSIARARAAAYDSSKGEIYVAIYWEGMVSTISDSSKTVKENISIGNRPWDIAYNPGTNELFVLHSSPPSISVIADENNSIVATVNLQGHPRAIAYDYGKDEIFVTNPETSTVLVIPHSVITYSSPIQTPRPQASLTATVTPSVSPYASPNPTASPSVPELGVQIILLMMVIAGIISITFVRLNLKTALKRTDP
jgi:DNA-binding beta-propeller fold protein YncE